MKNLLNIMALMIFSGGLLAPAVQAADSTQYPSLDIYNDWDYPVHVKEGHLRATNKDVAAKSSYNKMIFTHISDLEISYRPDGSGNWVQIPGCSRGTYASTLSGALLGGGANLKVFITGKESDPRIPVCRSEVFD
jgi:hypothetical protein